MYKFPSHINPLRTLNIALKPLFALLSEFVTMAANSESKCNLCETLTGSTLYRHTHEFHKAISPYVYEGATFQAVRNADWTITCPTCGTQLKNTTTFTRHIQTLHTNQPSTNTVATAPAITASVQSTVTVVPKRARTITNVLGTLFISQTF